MLPHDILDVRRITEFQSGGVIPSADIGTSSLGFQQEGVAVIPEEETFLSQPVDGFHLTSETLLDLFFERVWILGQ